MQVLNFLFVFCIGMSVAIIVFMVFRISRDQYEDYEKRRIDRLKEILERKKATTEEGIYEVIVVISNSSILDEIREMKGLKIIPFETVQSVEGISETLLKELRKVKSKHWFKPRFVVAKT